MRALLSFCLALASCHSALSLCLESAESCAEPLLVAEDVPLVARRELLGETVIKARQQPGVVAANIFLRRGYHGSVVVGNYVYIDGGAFSYTSGGSPQILYATTTLSIDISKSWVNSSVVINSYSKPSGVPCLDDGSLWYSEKENSLILGFSGAAARFNTPAPWPLGLWSFKLDSQGGGIWSRKTAATSAITSKSLTRPYQALSAFGGDSAFTLGGYENSRSSPATKNLTDSRPVPGIVQYNMATGTFTNSSASGYNFNGTAERGVLHYVPSFGPQGIYVILGGDVSDLDKYSAGQKLQSFQTLTIFDPATGTFYNQTTTGNTPNGRIEFCATGANSTNDTYEIFIYAGWGGHLGSAALPYDEIYILTLPAFQWIKVPYPPAKPRHGHTCETVGNRQMLVIGGVDTLQDTATNAAPSLDLVTFSTRDQFAQGLAIFDMTRLSWANQYDAGAPAYEQSDPVRNYYASNARDPATWATSGSKSLKDVFAVTHFTNPPSTPTPSSSATNAPTSSPKSSHTGAVVGGVVGGVLGLAAIAGLIFFLTRRRKRAAAASELPSNAAGGGAHTEDDGQVHYQGEDRGDFKPYAPVMSEVPGSVVAGREGYAQEMNTPPARYEMDARQTHEMA
ncbi:uncharacterized protein L3040_003988 [Drepanopeziza brunnea f. sp. 'multigermtubi']|uniref:uncharacterized protein n=1 Tax=Drepanopeziza brunnea f. sp. 'multigermtubi' TaxID=698441 RepID=UPI00238509D3|nr:hypothetical protein L3040_003988 [Drepanopeziza brunnea f. sp. 'multigermtubi']